MTCGDPFQRTTPPASKPSPCCACLGPLPAWWHLTPEQVGLVFSSPPQTPSPPGIAFSYFGPTPVPHPPPQMQIPTTQPTQEQVNVSETRPMGGVKGWGGELHNPPPFCTTQLLPIPNLILSCSSSVLCSGQSRGGEGEFVQA